MDPKAAIPVAWLRTVNRAKQFQVIQGKPVSVSIFVCVMRYLGTADLCRAPESVTSVTVNANDKLVLKAELRSGFAPFKSCEWQVETNADSGRDILSTSNVIANVIKPFANFLILRGGVLTPLRSIRLRFHIFKSMLIGGFIESIH